MKAVVPVNGNYAASFAVVSFTIKKKSIKATVYAAYKSFDGINFATVNATVDPDELVSGDSITITNLTGTFENQNAGSNKKVTVDSSGISISGTGAENYDVQIAPETTASISKLAASLTSSKTDLTYTGTAQSEKATVTNAVYTISDCIKTLTSMIPLGLGLGMIPLIFGLGISGVMKIFKIPLGGK